MSAVGLRNLIKILVRSRSLRFTADMVRQSPTSSLARLRWSGRDIFIDRVPPIHLFCIKFCSGAARKQSIMCLRL